MLREIRELLSYHLRSTSRLAQHDVRNVFEKALSDLKLAGLSEVSGRRVLDLGCGQRYPFALQCAAVGANVTALDIDYVKPDTLPLAVYRTVKHNGIKRAVKSAVRRVLWDNRYYHNLEANAGRDLRSYRSKVDFVVADPSDANYPLPSATFDLIVSIAVLEHVREVEKFAAEISRLLSPGGYFYAVIHNFYSLSGGHNLEWAFPDEHPPSSVPPWDHLRENRFPAWTYLNRYKPEQYKDAFSKELHIVQFKGVGINHDAGKPEGERFLTPGIAAELALYPRDLLSTRAWCVICKKI